MKARKSQSQRREETRQKVLDSACRLFGEHGFDHTSLDDIASDCKLTVTPVYHYFGNKLQLFAEVNAMMEQQLIALLDELAGQQPFNLRKAWDQFMDLCKQPGFAQIVLIDAPHVLGRERWKQSPVVARVSEILKSPAIPLIENFSDKDRELVLRMLMAALAEAALMAGSEPEHNSSDLVHTLLSMLENPRAG